MELVVNFRIRKTVANADGIVSVDEDAEWKLEPPMAEVVRSVGELSYRDTDGDLVTLSLYQADPQLSSLPNGAIFENSGSLFVKLTELYAVNLQTGSIVGTFNVPVKHLPDGIPALKGTLRW